MKTIQTKILFISLLFSAVTPSVMQTEILWDAITNDNETVVTKALESNIDIIKKQKVIEMSSTPLLIGRTFVKVKKV